MKNYNPLNLKELSGLDDERLVTLAKHSDNQRVPAFEILVRRHYAAAHGFAQSLLSSQDDADAVVQDALLRVYRNLGKFREEAAFRTWLFRIVQNQAFTTVTKRQREMAKRDALARESVATLVEEESDWDSQRDTDSARFQRIISDLSTLDQTILALRFVNERELHEIATIVGLKLSATKMRFYRALDALRSDYQNTDRWLQS